jgi:hypothetical protein
LGMSGFVGGLGSNPRADPAVYFKNAEALQDLAEKLFRCEAAHLQFAEDEAPLCQSDGNWWRRHAVRKIYDA